MDNVIFLVNRIAVSGGFAGLNASSLVDGYVDNYCASLHGLYHILRYHIRRSCPFDKHSPNQQVSIFNFFPYIVGIRHECYDIFWHDVIQIPESLDIDIENSNSCPKPSGHFGGIGAYNTATDDDHFCRSYSWYSAQKY